MEPQKPKEKAAWPIIKENNNHLFGWIVLGIGIGLLAYLFWYRSAKKRWPGQDIDAIIKDEIAKRGGADNISEAEIDKLLDMRLSS